MGYIYGLGKRKWGAGRQTNIWRLRREEVPGLTKIWEYREWKEVAVEVKGAKRVYGVELGVYGELF